MCNEMKKILGADPGFLITLMELLKCILLENNKINHPNVFFVDVSMHKIEFAIFRGLNYVKILSALQSMLYLPTFFGGS